MGARTPVNPRLLPPAAVARSVLRAQSDTRLTDLARAGSEPAFEAIVARHRRSLVRYCARVVGDADAEEATQDALLKAHTALLRGDQVRRLAPWLHVIAHNTALSYLRARSSRPQTADLGSDHFAVIDSSAESRDELRDVLAAVKALPERQRDALVMRELEGRSYDEIAARLGSSHGAVRQLLNRARHSVRERVGALLPVGPLVRWALAGAGGAEAAGGATVSGACVLGAKACAAALIPATVALIVSAPAPRHRANARHTRPGASTTYDRPAAPSRRVYGPAVGAGAQTSSRPRHSAGWSASASADSSARGQGAPPPPGHRRHDRRSLARVGRYGAGGGAVGGEKYTSAPSTRRRGPRGWGRAMRTGVSGLGVPFWKPGSGVTKTVRTRSSSSV